MIWRICVFGICIGVGACIGVQYKIDRHEVDDSYYRQLEYRIQQCPAIGPKAKEFYLNDGKISIAEASILDKAYDDVERNKIRMFLTTKP